jgi:hypothetical protein
LGTRAIIARPTEGGGFAGRYLHHDGAPHSAVSLLRDFVLNVRNGDVDAAVRYLIDEHPNGWNSLPASDGGGSCLCHDGDGTDMGLFTEDTDGDPVYAYVLLPDALVVLSGGCGGWEVDRTVPWAG